MERKDGRAFDELRPVKITTDFVKFAGVGEGIEDLKLFNARDYLKAII